MPHRASPVPAGAPRAALAPLPPLPPLPALPDEDFEYRPDDFDVKVSDMMVATADFSDTQLDTCIHDVLRALRERLKMDVAFVSEFVDGRRVFRQVDQGRPPVVPDGASDPLESSWCQMVVDGRLPGFVPDARPLQKAGSVPHTPLTIGTHLSTPVVLPDGEVYGTLCCFSSEPVTGASVADLKRLQFVAELAGKRLAQSRQR